MGCVLTGNDHQARYRFTCRFCRKDSGGGKGGVSRFTSPGGCLAHLHEYHLLPHQMEELKVLAFLSDRYSRTISTETYSGTRYPRIRTVCFHKSSLTTQSRRGTTHTSWATPTSTLVKVPAREKMPSVL
eukprot:6463456-Amphidinium_carterae.2